MRRTGLILMTVGASLALHVPTTKAEMLWFKADAQDSVETARKIGDITDKQRYFGRLEKKDDVDYFVFDATQGDAIDISIRIPKADDAFVPSLTLFGPGIGKPNEDPVIDIGSGNGAFVTRSKATDRDEVNDRFLLTTFLAGPVMTTTAPRTATYALAVRAPDGSKGRYVLSIDGEDKNPWSQFFARMIGYIRAILRNY